MSDLAGRAIKWQTTPDGFAADKGAFELIVSDTGWEVGIRTYNGCRGLESGPETGPAGKAAAEAAYRRICG